MFEYNLEFFTKIDSEHESETNEIKTRERKRTCNSWKNQEIQINQ